jgi:hypothetical protein
MEKLVRLPVPWHHVWRVAETLGAKPKRPVIFECVGVPGILDGIIASAPLYSRIVVAGVCAEPDVIRPVMAINKELDLRFVMGYTPLEFRDTLHLLADGEVNAAPIVTGTVGLPGVAAAFEALADPEKHAKILIDPASPAAVPTAVSLSRRAQFLLENLAGGALGRVSRNSTVRGYLCAATRCFTNSISVASGIPSTAAARRRPVEPAAGERLRRRLGIQVEIYRLSHRLGDRGRTAEL